MDNLDRLLSIVRLSIESARLMDQVKDVKEDLRRLADMVNHVCSVLEDHENVLIYSDENGKQRIGLFNRMIISDDDWEDILEPTTMIDSWEKFQDIFGQDLTHTAQDAVLQITQLFQVIKENLELMERIEENFKAMISTMRDEFDFPAHRIERLVETTASLSEEREALSELLKHLAVVRDVFPYDNDQTHLESDVNIIVTAEDISEEPFEECRSFPNAWP